MLLYSSHIQIYYFIDFHLRQKKRNIYTWILSIYFVNIHSYKSCQKSAKKQNFCRLHKNHISFSNQNQAVYLNKTLVFLRKPFHIFSAIIYRK